MDLSDNGDDFDLFFNAKKTKKPSSSAPQKSAKFSDPMEDLFGLEDTKDTRTPAPRKQLAVPAAKSNPVKSLLHSDPADDDDDLGFDPKKPKGALNKSQNLFDDLLGPLETKRPQTAAPANKPPAISRQSTDTTTDTSNLVAQTPQRPKTSQGRRSSNMSNVQNPDPLGLFTKEKDSTITEVVTPKPKKRGTTADWLGLNVEAQAEPEPPKPQMRSDTPKPSTKPDAKETAEILRLPEDTAHHSEEPHHDVFMAEEQHKDIAAVTQEPYAIDSTAHNIMLMNTLNLEAKQSFTALKYQEQQVMMATQMKQQENVLMEMQRKQDSLLQQQERQFQNLLQQQMQRHHQLEDLIKQQQQRINSHLQLMMSQPPLMSTSEDFEESSGRLDEARVSTRHKQHEEEEISLQRLEKEKQSTLDLIQFEADNKRLELENLRLEELIANTKSNYEKEIELLEKSYKKQIEVLENHLTSMEKRLKSEIEELQTHFQSKIETLEQEKLTLKKTYEEDFTNLKQDHEDELRKQRKNHEEDLDMLKEEHRRMLDNIRQAKMLEFAAVQEGGSYLECLKKASDNLSDLTGGLNELKENMRHKVDALQLEKEKKLEAREKRLEDGERRLKITEDSNETEKQRLMELVSTLELQMSKMSKETAEENWQLRQKLASLDAEKMAFAKEREFFREQMLRDEERIKELKDLQLMETQKLQAQVQEERTELHVEKSKFELEKRLHSNTDMQKEKLEIEAAMQVAQDAAHKADVERERYYKMQRQLEQQKRELADKEHSLGVKEEELHQELISYRMATRVSQEAQQKAKMAEQFYHNKIQMLQQRTQEIGEKESNLSQERLLLAQDRIALHALKTKLQQQTKCSLCQLSQKNREITESLNANLSSNENVLGKYHMPPQGREKNEMLFGGNVVERMLDANIEDSLRKMKSSANFVGWEMLLDDDHKKMVQNNDVPNNEEFK